MPGPDYYRQLFSSFRTVDEEEKKKKPFSFDDLLQDLSKYAIESPYYEETVKGAGKEPLYPGQPAEAWIPKNIAETFKQAIQLSDNPSEMENRLYSSYYVSQAKQIPFDEAFQNLDSILQHDYGEALSPKSGLEAVANAYKASLLNQSIAKNYFSLKNKYLSGQYTTWEEAEKDPDYQSILTLEKEMPPQDYIKRSLPINILKATAQIIPSWTETLLKGATAGMVAKILTTVGAGLMQVPSPQTVVGGAIVSLIPTIATLAGKLASGAEIASNTRELEGGAAFRDMMEFQDPMTGQKINPKIAALAATAYEGLGTVVQMAMMGQYLGSFSSKLNGAQIEALKDAILSTAKSAPDAAERSGLLLRIVNTTAGKFFLRYGETVGSQTLAAGLREGFQIWSTETAKQITNKLDGSSIAPKTLDEITSSLANTMATTAMSMAAMALIPSAYSVWRESNINAKIAQHEAIQQAGEEYINKMEGRPAEGSSTEWSSTEWRPSNATQPKLIAPGNQATGETTPPTINPIGGSPIGGSPVTTAPSNGPEIFFKELEPAPGIMEIRGTTQNLGETRKATIRGFFATDDENKIIRVSSIAPLGDIKKNPDESLRQTVDLLKHVKDTLPDYQIIFNPTTELLKKAKDTVLAENPDFFNKPPAPELKPIEQITSEQAAPEQTPPEEVPLEQVAPEQAMPEQAAPQTKESNEQNIIKPQQALEPQNIEKTTPLTPTEIAPEQPSVQTPANAIAEIQPQETEKGKTIVDAIKTVPPEAQVTIQSALSPEYNFIHEDKFPVADIKFHPELPNFKEGSNERGVVKGQELQGKPNYLGFAPIVLWQANDGQYYIVTGRHRLDLWTRNNEPTIPVDILREKDGYTTEDMAQLDAEMNIRDGQGTEKDYERYFKRLRGAYTYEGAEGRGLLRKAAGQNGFWIGTYAGPDLESLYLNGILTGDKARAIAEVAKDDEDLQKAGIQIAKDKSLKADDIANALYYIKGSKLSEASQPWLDGIEKNEPSVLETQTAIGKAATEIQKDIAKQLAIWRSSIRLSAEDRRKVIEAAGYSVGNVDKSAESIVDELSYKATQWAGSNWATNHDLVLQAKVKAGVATEEEQLEWELLNAEQAQNGQILAKQPETSPQIKSYFDEEQYLAEHGASKHDMGDASLHKNRGGMSDKEWQKVVDREAERSAAIMAKREELRKEYQQKIASGEIREMSKIEKLIATANGNPDNESTQAARRLLEKKGIEWKKEESPPEQAETLFENKGKYEPANQYASPWKYKAAEVVQQKIKGAMPGKQILNTLIANGVKQEELKWTGLDDFLDTDQKISPQEALDYIEANKLVIKEVIKEDKSKKVIGHGMDGSLQYGYDYTKYHSWALPGGKDYREILFTLPADVSEYFAKAAKLSEEYALLNKIAHDTNNPEEKAEYAEKARDKYNDLLDLRDAIYAVAGVNDLEPYGVVNKNIDAIFRAPHWSEGNIVAHTRVDDRLTSDDKDALFIEEIQSDWHQKGREFGYKDELAPPKIELKKLSEGIWDAKINDGPAQIYRGKSEEEVRQKVLDRYNSDMDLSGVPPAPFSKTWHEFVFKRMLKDAVEQGYDYLAWTTGKQQSDRYSLSKYIDSIEYKANDDNTYYVEFIKNKKMLHELPHATPETIQEYIGKELTKKIINGEGDSITKTSPISHSSSEWKSISGLDLDIGNKGMYGFYDKMLVDFANKYGKKWGAQVQDIKIHVDGAFTKKLETVHALPITDQMRGAIPEGQYLFEDAKTKYGLEIEKSEYREQMLKALDLMKLLAANLDNFFNKEIQDFISKNNTALIAALMNAKTKNIAFENPKIPNVKFTITPAADGSKSWDLNYYKNGEIVYAERYKSRTQAIENVYTEAALPYGDVGDWQLNTTAKELYDVTPNQIGDMVEAIKNEAPIEYDEKTLKIVYGSKENYDKADKSLSIKTEGAAPIQQSLFDFDENPNEPSLFSDMDQGELFENGQAEYSPSNAAPRPVVHYRQAHISDILGPAGTVRYPAYVENRKGQKRVSFVGQRIASAEDIATLFQVYRNSSIETFHLIYLDSDGKILAHNALSSGQPGFTTASESADNARFQYYLKDRMARLGAKHIILMHNHPSGDVTPSPQDVSVQARYEKLLGDAVLYHVIIDHGEATVFNINKNLGGNAYLIKQDKIKFNASGYSLSTEQLPEIHNPKTAIEYAASVIHGSNAKNILIIVDNQLRVISWRPISYTEPQKIYQAIRESGGSSGFAITSSKAFFDIISKNYEDAIGKGGKFVNLVDIIYSESSLFPSVDDEKVINGRVDDTRYKVQRSRKKITHSFLFENDPLYLSKEAMEFDNYDDFKKAYQGEQGDEEELKSAWQAAQKEKASAISTEDFIRSLKNDPEKLRAFLEANGADLFDKKVARKTMNVVDATSYRIATGGVVSDATMNRTLALIEKNASKWKARYDELMGNTEARPSDFEITTNEPDENIDLLLAKYKEAMAKLPENAQLSQLSEEISKNTKVLREELQKNQNKLKEYQDRFSYAEKRLVDMERELLDINKRIFAERAKKKMGKANGDLLLDLETHKKELAEMIDNRTKALSPESGLRNAAYLAAQKAVQETRQKLREQLSVQRAKKAQRELMLYYAKEIMRPPAKNVDFKVALQIKELQQQLDPHFRRMSAEDQNVIIELPGKKPLNLWDIKDLQELYQQVSDLRDYGAILYEERMAKRKAEQDAIRYEMSNTAIETGKERPAYMYGTDEFRAQQQADKSIFKNFDISLTTIHRITRALDGGKEGIFYKTIAQPDRDAFTREKNAFDKRRTAFETRMKELGLDRDALYKEKVNLGSQHISKWEAIALYIGIQNPKTEAAIVYGNMMSIDDKAKLPDEEFYQKAAENRAAIRRAISTLTPQEIALAEWLIQEGRDNYQRLADATYEYENRIPVQENAYYPHERKMRTGEEPTAEEIMDQVMARAAKAMVNVGKQPTIERIAIGDRHQTPINLDAYQVYLRTWETQEHYIAYAPLITKLNGIFKSRNAETLRDKIRRYHGQSYIDYIDRWISEAANPKAFKDFNATTQGTEKMFQLLRGALGIAYLGLRASRGVFQLITSPAPFFPYAGAYMVKQMVENLNPASFMKNLAFAKENSAFIRHRVINPIDAFIKEYIEAEPSEAKRIAMQMMGAIMEWADMWSVSTGWEAVYNKTAAGLRESGKTAEEIHDIAYKEADKILQETQPTYRHEDLAPAFKMDSQLQRFLFQFQTPLNVIYNQLFHDAPNDWKNGHRGRSLAIWFGYMAVMGLIALITAPKGKDDDEEKKAKRFLSGMATAPLDTIPFVGNVASGFVESAITGDRFYRDDQIFPGVTKLFEGAYTAMTTQDEESRLRAYLKMLEASGMFVGVPTSALKEYSRVIFKGDWGALWGQREY